MANDVHFIRVHGRVVPIKDKKAAGGSKMSSKQYANWKKNERVASSYSRGDIKRAKSDFQFSKNVFKAGIVGAFGGAVIKNKGLAAIGVGVAVLGLLSAKIAERDVKNAKMDKKGADYMKKWAANKNKTGLK